MTKVKIGDLAQPLEKVKKENNIGADSREIRQVLKQYTCLNLGKIKFCTCTSWSTH